MDGGRDHYLLLTINGVAPSLQQEVLKMVSHERTTITWPDLLNELYDNTIIQDLSPQVGLLLHAIIYKFNKMWFRGSLCISNTELQCLSHLNSKQFYTARKKLLAEVNKKMREEYNYGGKKDFLTYTASGDQNKAGRYFMNCQPILERLTGELQANYRGTVKELRENSGGTKCDSFPCDSQIEGENGKDHNITQPNQIQFNENNNDNINKDNDVSVVLDNNVDENFVELLHKEIETKLMNEGMNKHNFNKLAQTYNWDQIVETYNVVSGHSVIKSIDNYVGYFVNTLKNISSENIPT